MGIEIERKFLVEKDLWFALKKPAGKEIRQAYLVNEPGKVIRIRITDDSAFITIKGEAVNIARPEFEFPVPADDAEKIMDLFTKEKIEKTRYRIEHKGKTWEVDEFWGDNDGLVMAEIELAREDEEFESPAWIGKEVTRDRRYYNAYLSEHPFNTWK